MPPILQTLGLASPQASRLFIDSIRDVTSKWANWDPALPIKVGDFGTVNKETGELEVKGNIYDVGTQNTIFRVDDAHIRELVVKHPALSGPREDDFYAVSLNGHKVDEVDKNASEPGIADASIKGRWKFRNSSRGAVLLMVNPQTSYIPPGVLLEDLKKVEALKDMILVTQVLSCSAYSLYLSNSRDDDVTLALIGSAPIPHAPGSTIGGGANAKWWASNPAGLFRNGLDPEGTDKYAPLYTVKKIRGKYRSRRGLPDPIFTGDDLWQDVEPPWDVMDQDGNLEDENVEDLDDF